MLFLIRIIEKMHNLKLAARSPKKKSWVFAGRDSDPCSRNWSEHVALQHVQRARAPSAVVSPARAPGALVGKQSRNQPEHFLDFLAALRDSSATTRGVTRAFRLRRIHGLHRHAQRIDVDGEPEQVNAVAITRGLSTPTLGVTPPEGPAGPSSQEDEPGGPKVAILSYEYWQRAASAAANRRSDKTIMLNGGLYTIVGVTPRALGNPYSTVLLNASSRGPSSWFRGETRSGTGPCSSGPRRISKPGVTLAGATSEASVLARDAYRAAFPGETGREDGHPRWSSSAR